MNGQDERSGDPAAGDRGGRAESGLIQLENHAIPANLKPFVTALFTWRCAAARISDVLPAAVGYLLVVLEGKCTFRFATGRSDPAYPVTLLAPTSAATGLEIDGPWQVLAAELSTFGWMALTGLHAGRHLDRSHDAAKVLGAAAEDLDERLRALARASPDDGAAQVAELTGFIEPRLQPLYPPHENLIAKTTAWLYASFDPQPADLIKATGYSPRQLQRLVERYFGTGPKQLARKYRALRVAGVLFANEASEVQTAELLNLFYDQSHMIREMRHFVGRTPVKFSKDRTPVLSVVNELRGHRELRPDLARDPSD